MHSRGLARLFLLGLVTESFPQLLVRLDEVLEKGSRLHEHVALAETALLQVGHQAMQLLESDSNLVAPLLLRRDWVLPLLLVVEVFALRPRRRGRCDGCRGAAGGQAAADDGNVGQRT